MIVKCKYCDKEFSAWPSRIKKGFGRYCSHKCHDLSRKKRIIKTCEQCGKKFETTPYKINTGNRKYCSIICHRLTIRKYVTKICLICGKVFNAKAYSIKRGGGKYCSYRCSGLAQRKRVIKICQCCGKSIEIKISEIKDGGNYCSTKCYGMTQIGKTFSAATKHKLSVALSGENHPRWKGGLKAKWKRATEKRKYDLKYQLNDRIRRSINNSLKKGAKNNRHWCDLVGYNAEILKKHLEKTMPIGYTWIQFLSGELHLDHKVPVSAFNFEVPENIDFSRCWSLDNLQLLPAKKNQKKYNKLIVSFQPSFKL